MVDLKTQYLKLKTEIDEAIEQVLLSTQYIKGQEVKTFEIGLANYLDIAEVISCANGTDALQIALMVLDLKSNDEVIVPAFSYAATLEVIVLLGIKPVLVDVEYDSFNLDPEKLESKITENTKVILPVHLFGQQCNMTAIMEIANSHNLTVIEDNAQSLGSTSHFNNSKSSSGLISTTSFFPSKNLGCYGDGGALYTNDKELAQKIRQIANHGQSSKYIHDIIGVNSRLDTIQAAVLNIKLKHLNNFIQARQSKADLYDELLQDCPNLVLPKRCGYSDHCFHQYTLKVTSANREAFSSFLKSKDIPFSVYYPLALHQQKAYKHLIENQMDLSVSEKLSNQVISLPMHPDLPTDQIEYICSNIKLFFNG